MKVTYLEGAGEEDEEPDPTAEKTVYTGQVINCDLDLMLIHVRWPGSDGDDWVSLLEDDWDWIDGAPCRLVVPPPCFCKPPAPPPPPHPHLHPHARPHTHPHTRPHTHTHTHTHLRPLPHAVPGQVAGRRRPSWPRR